MAGRSGYVEYVGLIIINVILVTLAVGVVALSVRSRRLEQRDPRSRPDYVPRFWSSGPWTDWLSHRPWRMFWYLVLSPTAGLIAGVILLVAHDGFGGLLIAASLVGAWRIHGPAQQAFRAARAPDARSSRNGA